MRMRAFTLLQVLPWLVAGSSFALFAASTWKPGQEPSSEIRVDGSAEELRRLRLEASRSAAEKEALRRELDRLVARGPGGQVSKVGHAPDAAADGASAENAEDLKALTERARNALLSGDTDEAMKALNELSRSGREGLRVLEELYASLEDPAARRSLLGPLLFSADREEGLLFLGSELASEDDPAMRDALLAVTSEFVTRGTSSALEAAFLRGAETSGNPSVQAAALRALRYARGPQVEQALLNAASSPHEGVRLAAFEQIALRPELRRRIADLIRRDPSQRVRRIGECRLLIAESGR